MTRRASGTTSISIVWPTSRPWDDVLRSIVAPIACGAFDGYSGLALPSVDGTSIHANRAIHELMSEVIRQASNARQRPLQ